MKKLFKIYSFCSLLLSPSLTVSCTKVVPSKIVTAPYWTKKMISQSKDKMAIGYDHYYLNNLLSSSDFTDYDWLDISKSNKLFIYVPGNSSISSVVSNLKINDTALTFFTSDHEITPINWEKNNDNTYTNNSFITQDTTVDGVSLLNNIKYNLIKTAKYDTWSKEEQDSYNNSGAVSSEAGSDWWVANGWDKLLDTDKNITYNGKTFSQYDVYQSWIHQEWGMNVALSLINENSFIFAKTNIKDLYCLTINSSELLIDKAGNIISVPCPHWGFTLEFKNLKKFTPEFIDLDNTFQKNDITSYLNDENYLSFNSQEKTKYSKYYIS